MVNKAIFLDRDGTINVEKDYLHKIEDFEFEQNAIEALQIMKNLGYLLIVVTNQSGIARGYYTEADLNILNDYLISETEKHGCKIDKIYYCPHHPDGHGHYRRECQCRKPKTGMIDQAIKEFHIDREQSYMVGDSTRDIQAGMRAGLQVALVSTGHGAEAEPEIAKKNICKNEKLDVYPTLYEFAKKLEETSKSK